MENMHVIEVLDSARVFACTGKYVHLIANHRTSMTVPGYTNGNKIKFRRYIDSRVEGSTIYDIIYDGIGFNNL